ncbi:hypothetical protein FKM82_016517 [Ascaphus truei]
MPTYQIILARGLRGTDAAVPHSSLAKGRGTQWDIWPPRFRHDQIAAAGSSATASKWRKHAGQYNSGSAGTCL